MTTPILLKNQSKSYHDLLHGYTDKNNTSSLSESIIFQNSTVRNIQLETSKLSTFENLKQLVADTTSSSHNSSTSDLIKMEADCVDFQSSAESSKQDPISEIGGGQILLLDLYFDFVFQNLAGVRNFSPYVNVPSSLFFKS
jgi:hypothetical protein